MPNVIQTPGSTRRARRLHTAKYAVIPASDIQHAISKIATFQLIRNALLCERKPIVVIATHTL